MKNIEKVAEFMNKTAADALKNLDLYDEQIQRTESSINSLQKNLNKIRIQVAKFDKDMDNLGFKYIFGHSDPFRIIDVLSKGVPKIELSFSYDWKDNINKFVKEKTSTENEVQKVVKKNFKSAKVHKGNGTDDGQWQIFCEFQV